MAIIYSYPNKSVLVGDDEILLIDSQSTNPTKQTKHTSLSSVLAYVDSNLVYDLQQVLTAGATAYVPVGTGWNGQLKLGYNNGSSNVDRITIDTSSGAAAILNLSGNTIQTGDHELRQNSSDFILGGGALTATVGNNTNIRSALGMDVAISPTVDFRVQTDADINHQSRDFIGIYNRVLDLRAVSGASLAATNGVANVDGNTINISASTVAELKAGTNTIVSTDGSTNSTVNIGGTTSGNRADGLFMQTENFFQVRTNTGQAKFYIIGGALPGADSDYINSVHPHTFMSEIRLGGTAATFDETAGTKLTGGTKGSAGAVGQLLSSRGPGASATWIDQDTIEPSQVVQLITNKSGGTLNYGDVVSIDPSPPNQALPDVIKADNTTLLPAIGVVCDVSIANNAEGKINKIGLLSNVPSSQFVGTTPVEGQIAYMAGGVDAGKMTVDRPTGAATGIQNVGIITRVNSGGTSFNLQVVAIGRTNALPNNDANALFTTNASNLPISTLGKFEVDVANNTIEIGDSALATDVTIKSIGDFRCEVRNSTAAGIENLQIGYQSLEQAMLNGGTARSNVAIGIRAMQGNAPLGSAAGGSYNVAVGNDTLNSNQNLFSNVTGNTAIGHQALQGGPTNIADYNTAIGYQALINLAGVAMGTADNNTAVGASALFNVTSGGENTSIGVGSGQAITSGTKNTFLGHNSGTTVGILTEATAVGQNADVQANGGTAIGQDTIVSAPGSIALGKGAVAGGPNTININVANVNGVQPNGGLLVTTTATPPAGLQPGDVYVVANGAPGNTTGHQLLAIMP